MKETSRSQAYISLETEINVKKEILEGLKFRTSEKVAVLITMGGWSIGTLAMGIGAFGLNPEPLSNIHTGICLGLAAANTAIGYKFNRPYFQRKDQLKKLQEDIDNLNRRSRMYK